MEEEGRVVFVNYISFVLELSFKFVFFLGVFGVLDRGIEKLGWIWFV